MTALPMMVLSAVAPSGSDNASVGQALTHSGVPSCSSAHQSHQFAEKSNVGVRMFSTPSSRWAGAMTSRGQIS